MNSGKFTLVATLEDRLFVILRDIMFLDHIYKEEQLSLLTWNGLTV